MKNTTILLLLKMVLACSILMSCFNPLNGFAQQNTAGYKTAVQPDGQHDFDFNFGKWRTHVQRLQSQQEGPAT